MVTPPPPSHTSGLQNTCPNPVQRSSVCRTLFNPDSVAWPAQPSRSSGYRLSAHQSRRVSDYSEYPATNEMKTGVVNLNAKKRAFKMRSLHPLPAPASEQQGCDVWLCFQSLSNFELVTNQFANQGLEFSNTIAIQPSNPAFPPDICGDIVLMGSPKAGRVEVCFTHQAPRRVSLRITSSRTVIMAALDREGALITQTDLASGNLATNTLENSNGEPSSLAPNADLTLTAPSDTIANIVIQSSGGQFVITRLGFQY